MRLRRYSRGGLAAAITGFMITGLTMAASQTSSFGAAKPPPKLKGEQLSSAKGTAGKSAKCKAASGSFTFKVSGHAAGPYPGTFTATGSVTLKKNAPSRYSATIHIASKKGKVTLTESLAKSPDNKGFCLPGYGLATAKAAYHATVVIRRATSKQTGTASGAVTGGAAKTSQLRQFLG